MFVLPSFNFTHDTKILMEYLPGGDLTTLPKRMYNCSAETWLRVLHTIAVSLFQGLTVLHNMQKVHRDIKPTNVFWTCENKKLIVKIGLYLPPTPV